MSDEPELRASDADRKAVVDELTRHCGEGRLTLGETEDRVAAAWEARTLGELRELLHDLPTTKRSGPPERLRPPRSRRLFDVHLRIYLTVMAFLVLIWFLTDPGGYFWPIWPALGWGLGVGIHKAVDVR